MINLLRILGLRTLLLIVIDVVLAGLAQILAIISALKFEAGDLCLFWSFTAGSLLCGTACGIISWWSWWQLRKLR